MVKNDEKILQGDQVVIFKGINIKRANKDTFNAGIYNTM
jgi:hypothetical protein